MSKKIFVDFDGTLAYQKDEYEREIGKPIYPMIQKVRNAINNGHEIVIFTARAKQWADEREKIGVENFCKAHLGIIPRITATKEHGIDEIWDDKAREVIKNEGEFKWYSIMNPSGVINYD